MKSAEVFNRKKTCNRNNSRKNLIADGLDAKLLGFLGICLLSHILLTAQCQMILAKWSIIAVDDIEVADVCG